jgi:hypothetical protein
MLASISGLQWNVYAKAPFGGPAQIVEYLGRYTHKVAITAHRILQITNSSITFKYKDYAANNSVKHMQLSHAEFVRRFAQHILPSGFVKIRHAGYLTHRNKNQRIASILQQLQLPAAMPKVKLSSTLMLLLKTGKDVTLCPVCGIGTMQLIATYINVNGVLVNHHSINNRGSPRVKKTNNNKQ